MDSRISRWWMLPAIAAGTLSLSSPVLAQELEVVDCQSLSGAAAASCREALKQDAAASVFVQLGEKLLEVGNFPLAVKVLKRGLQLHPDNSELQAGLTVAESQLKEWEWMREKASEEYEKAKQSAKADIFKCTTFATSAPQVALQGCDAALAMMPRDPSLLEAKGDALNKLGNKEEAYLAYAEAAQREPSDALSEKLAALSEFRPEPPKQVVKAEPQPKPEPEPEPKKEPEPEPEVAEEEREAEADRRAALLATVNDPDMPLVERLKAQNLILVEPAGG